LREGEQRAEGKSGAALSPPWGDVNEVDREGFIFNKNKSPSPEFQIFGVNPHIEILPSPTRGEGWGWGEWHIVIASGSGIYPRDIIDR